MFQPTIGTRITFPFLIAIAITAVLGAFVVTRLVAGSLQERFNNQLLDSAQAAQNTITDVERQQLRTLRAMVFTTGVAEAILAEDLAMLDQLLRPLAVNADADALLVFDEAGQPVYYLRRVRIEERLTYQVLDAPDISSWEGVARITRQESDLLGDKFVDVIPQDSETLFYISAPVVDEDNKLIGGISLGLNAENLSQRLSEQALSAVTLFDKNGHILSSTLPLDETEYEDYRVEHPAGVIAAAAEAENRLQRLELDGSPYQMLYTNFRMRDQLLGLTGVALPTNFVTERIGTSRNIFVLLFSLLLFAVALMGVMTTRSIVRPVIRMVATTRAIRAGDLKRRVGLRRRDELGELSTSFDHMTDQLLRRNQQVLRLYQTQKQESARREAVLASISDAVFVQDLQGNTIMANKVAVGLSHFPDIPPLLKKPQDLFEARTLVLPNKKYYQVVATPVYLAQQKLLGYVVVLHDITPLVESERLKDDILDQMSHELRTPLGAIRGYVELVSGLESNLSERSTDFLQKALLQISTLEGMVNTVVAATSALSNRFQLDRTRFDIQVLVNERVREWQPRFDEKQLSLSLNCQPSAVEVLADRPRIGQVVDHLLQNAYNYTLGGGAVEVQVSERNAHALLMVRDSGVGIAEEEQERVFERLYRGQAAAAGLTDSRGLGLGLFLSKLVVEAHGGTIRLESQLDVGTTVTVMLPQH